MHTPQQRVRCFRKTDAPHQGKTRLDDPYREHVLTFQEDGLVVSRTLNITAYYATLLGVADTLTGQQVLANAGHTLR